jgi:outer membrane lipoprotein LolB
VRRLAAFLAALVLSGCASVARVAPPEAAEGDLRLTGRLSVVVAGSTGKATGGSAAFELLGNPAAGQLELISPLGTLAARASWAAGTARLQTPEDERRFDDLDALTRELLGEPVPVAALFDWLNGKPWPQAASTPTDSGFEQLGWQIDLAKFGEGLIVAIRRAEPMVTLRARLDTPTNPPAAK